MTTTHSPLPWRVFDRRNAPLKNICFGRSEDHDLVGEVRHVHQRDYRGGFRGDDEAADAVDQIGLANAALIVRSVNALPGLVAAAEAALDELKSMDYLHPDDKGKAVALIANLRTALSAAKGEPTA